ncbi:MAG TPA: prolipoprotein diacylglyceryl transferase [Atribacteraceae bacterium]|nr:prolipoprotein diacylglyceryl transferase [Atribacteraceae bacterium]
MMQGGFNPVAFSIGPLTIRWYGVAMALSIFLAIWYLLRKGKSLGIKEEALLTMSFLAVICGLIGARLVFVAANHPDWFWRKPVQIFKVYEGGLAWHGGLLGGVAAAWWYLRFRVRISFNLVADLAVPGLGLGYSLIRVANIINQEILGRPTDFSFGRWPAQSVGIGIGIFLFIRYFYLDRYRLPIGYQFWSFVFYHQILRGLLEETIRDMPLVIAVYLNRSWGMGFFTAAQVATLPILLFVWRMWPRKDQEASPTIAPPTDRRGKTTAKRRRERSG